MAAIIWTSILSLIFTIINVTSALQCFECGAYIPPDNYGSPVKLLPCPPNNLSIANDLKECKIGSNYCLKYVSQGIEVRKCAETCTDDYNPYADRLIACCDQDACNHGHRVAKYELVSVVIGLVITLIFIYER